MIEKIKALHQASEKQIRAGIAELQAVAGEDGFSNRVLRAVRDMINPMKKADFSSILDPLLNPISRIQKGIEGGSKVSGLVLDELETLRKEVDELKKGANTNG